MIRPKGIATHVFDLWNSSTSSMIAAIPLRNLRSCSWSRTHLCSSSRSWVRSRSFLEILSFLEFIITSDDSMRDGGGRMEWRKGCGSIWNGRWEGDRRPNSGRGGEGTTNMRYFARQPIVRNQGVSRGTFLLSFLTHLVFWDQAKLL